jgi:bifunctional DNase/RNase
MIRVEIDSIRVSLMTQDRVVVLKDTESDRYLPIWIGPFEADALRVELAGMEVTRPLTHDLLKTVIVQLGGRVEHVVVNELSHEVFYARVKINVDGRSIDIDARPSDAINLAVRMKVPIFVEESVMDKAGIRPEDEIDAETESAESRPAVTGGEGGSEAPDDDLGVFKDFLNTLDLDDLGDE